MYNLNYAFEVAEQHLDIPKMLDAEGNFHTFILCFSFHFSKLLTYY